MTKYFSFISHDEADERDYFYSQIQLPSKLLSIGWGKINPINKSKEEIKHLIETFYPDFRGTVNPDNGAKSLSMFTNLNIGDIVFIRGKAKILDSVIITGKPVFDTILNDGYFLKIPFKPFFENIRMEINTVNIHQDIYNEVIFDGGRTLVLREIGEIAAKKLLGSIFGIM
ncbi:MAG: hypothetical protein Q8M15_02025 [Bacteroidota bacterium]|nr:hypothetical protein [Bacteroidota bacterium]